jgi:hypothetical protein
VELKDQTAIETGLFVRWIYDAPKFGFGVKGNAAFSNTTKVLQIDGFNYAPLDRVVSITSSTSNDLFDACSNNNRTPRKVSYNEVVSCPNSYVVSHVHRNVDKTSTSNGWGTKSARPLTGKLNSSH